MTHRRHILLLLLLALAGVVPAGAAELSVTAAFTRPIGEVGVPLQFQIQVSGSRQNSQPPEVRVDGLEFDYIGPQISQQSSFTFGSRLTTTLSVVHVYQVTPERAGQFIVPALELEVEGRRLRTQPVGLRVEGEGTRRPADGGVQAEIVLSKSTAYVGEMVPAELVISASSQTRMELEEMPTFEGDGFTKLKFGQPEQTLARSGTGEARSVVFRTVITPIRAGKVSVGPSKASVAVQVPRFGRSQRSLLQDWFNDPLSSFGQLQRRKVIAPAVDLTVKPLPAAGRPKTFTGAVGQFTFSAEEAPDRVKLNDPLTMKLLVSGSGNFERVAAPKLVDSTGWRVYPPTENFQAEDQNGTRGTKTFEIAVIPEAKQTHLPVFEFAAFDPVAEKYVTLRTKPEPLVVEGEPAPPRLTMPLSPNSPAQRSAAAPPPPPPSAAPPTDILSIRYDFGAPRSFRPLYREPAFLGVNGALLLTLAGVALARSRRPRRDQARLAQLRRERNELLARLPREEDRQAFYDTAARVLQLEAALRTGRAPETVDAAVVRRVAPGNGETSTVLDEIFDARAEALYAGSGAAGPRVTAPERERIMGALSTMGKAIA
jgi:hypothetical protein